MTEINPVGTTTQTSTATTTAAQTEESAVTAETITSDFDTFIQLLTAQVRNQDPLSPLDSTQFVEQLATFSNLEQQVRSNDTLDSIAAMIGDMQSMLASEWIGEQIEVESSWVPYTGDAVEFTFDLPENADRAALTVRDPSGNEIFTQALDADAPSQSWLGQTSAGGLASPDGLYNFSIDLYSGDDFLGALAPRIITTVTDISSENGKTSLGTSAQLSADVESARKVTAE
ncbi:MAG: flagellar hook capping FlgD N-terminal domain-containing protein [Pseudomonadota bacterium]